jgi:hypothetical protein
VLKSPHCFSSGGDYASAGEGHAKLSFRFYGHLPVFSKLVRILLKEFSAEGSVIEGCFSSADPRRRIQ